MAKGNAKENAGKNIADKSFRSRRFFALVAAAVIASGALGFFLFTQYRTVNEPQDAVSDFVSALNAGDLDAAFQHSDLAFVSNETILSRAREEFTGTENMTVHMRRVRNYNELDGETQIRFDSMAADYAKKLGVAAKDFAVVDVILRENGTQNETAQGIYCVRIRDRWYVSLAYLFWGDEPAIQRALQMSGGHTEGDYWVVDVVSGNMRVDNTTNILLQKNNTVVAGYAFTNATINPPQSGEPNGRLAWYDLNLNGLLDGGDQFKIKKPDNADGEYFLSITHKSGEDFGRFGLAA